MALSSGAWQGGAPTQSAPACAALHATARVSLVTFLPNYQFSFSLFLEWQAESVLSTRHAETVHRLAGRRSVQLEVQTHCRSVRQANSAGSRGFCPGSWALRERRSVRASCGGQPRSPATSGAPCSSGPQPPPRPHSRRICSRSEWKPPDSSSRPRRSDLPAACLGEASTSQQHLQPPSHSWWLGNSPYPSPCELRCITDRQPYHVLR